MAELERDMEVDSHAAEPNQWSKPPLRSWELTKLRDTITAVFTQMLEPIRQVVREEILRATNYETREEKPPAPDTAYKVRELEAQLQQLKAEKHNLDYRNDRLHGEIAEALLAIKERNAEIKKLQQDDRNDQSEREIAQATLTSERDAQNKKLQQDDRNDQLQREIVQANLAISERDAKIKKLQRVIVENSQNITPPMDDEIITMFNQLNHDIMRIVKKHFANPFRPGESRSAVWQEYKTLSPENKELWVRAFIADELYQEFFLKKHRIFGLDAQREELMKGFELALKSSGEVKEADIVDWRIRTVSCAQKLRHTHGSHRFRDPAYETVQDLRPVGPRKGSEESAAEDLMAAIYETALNIAILFRSNKVSYFWLQNKPASSIDKSEREIIGSTDLSRPAELWKPWRIVFGGVVKNPDSGEDRVGLTKSELLMAG